MSDGSPDFDAEAVIDAMTPLLGLPVSAEFRPGIVTNLQVTARFATILLAADFGDEDEAAPVFVP